MENRETDEELGKRLAELCGFDIAEYDDIMFCPNVICPPPANWCYLRETVWVGCESLCTDLNAIAEVEKIVIEKDKYSAYGNALERLIKPYNPNLVDSANPRTKVNPKLRGNWVYLLATASARTRARACYLALSCAASVMER